MSVAWSRYIREKFREWELTPSAAHLLEVLGHYANGDDIAYPSTETLARRMLVSERSVKRARRELRDQQVLVVISGNGRGHSTLYALPSLKGDTAGPLSDKGGHQRAERGTPAVSKGVTGDPPSIHEGSIEGRAIVSPTGSCARCGTRFDHDHSTGDVCGRCWFIEVRANRKAVTG